MRSDEHTLVYNYSSKSNELHFLNWKDRLRSYHEKHLIKEDPNVFLFTQPLQVQVLRLPLEPGVNF